MKIKALLLFILMSIGKIYSQEITLNGQIRDSNNQPINYFNVDLISDTTTVLKGSFVDGNLILKLPEAKEYVLKISSLGYEDKYVNVSPDNTKNPEVYYLDDKTYSLDAVTVTASKPKLTLKNNNYILGVDNTYLANEGSINNVLSKLPFVVLDSNNQVSIVGKNNVVVYIDNRKIIYNQELESISPINIKDIQLINNPGSRYDANADAVILIKTKKEHQEGITSSVRTLETFSKAFSYNINPNFNYHYNKINVYLDYIYANSRSKSKENTLTKNVLNDFENNIYNDGYYKSSDHTYTIGLDYELNKKNRLSFQLLGWNNRSNPDVNIDNRYFKNSVESTVKTEKDIHTDEDHYDFSVNYEANINDNHRLTSSFNYTLHNTSNNEKINEIHPAEQVHHIYDFDNHNHAFDYQLNYSWNIEKVDLGVNVGTKISYVSNDSESNFFEDSTSANNRFTYVYDFKEIIPAYYIELSKTIRKVNIDLGVRMEHTNFEGNYENTQVIDTTYFNVFPSLNTEWSINKQNKLNLSYSKRVSRPSFRNLSPNIRYDNIFFYRQGNPNLLPTITDDVSLSYTVNKIRLNVGYRHRKNANIYNYFQDEVDPDITVVILDNHKSMNIFYAGGFYQFVSKKFTSSNSFTYTKPFATLNYNNGTIKMNRPAYYFKTSNDFLISDKITLYVDFTYNDLGETLLERKKRMYNLAAGIYTSFLEKKLSVSLAANDILNTNNYEDYRTYGNYSVLHEYFPDDTFVQLNIRYNFSIGSKSYRVRNNNASTVRRL